MKVTLILVLVAVLLFLFVYFVPIWPKPGKGGNVYRVDTWTKIQLLRGKIFID